MFLQWLHITPYFPCVQVVVEWTEFVESQKIKSTCQIDLKTTKRKLDDCTSSLDLFITDNAMLRVESVFMCRRETDVETERQRERDRSMASLYQRSAAWPGWDWFSELWSVTSLDLFPPVGLCFCFLCLTQILWKENRKQKIQKRSMEITRALRLITYQRIKHLKPVSMWAFIQNTKKSVQGIL